MAEEEIKGNNEGLGILIDEKGNKEYLQLSEEGRKELEDIDKEFKLDELDKSITAYTSEIRAKVMMRNPDYQYIWQESRKRFIEGLITDINSVKITTKSYNNKSTMDCIENLLNHKLNKLNNKPKSYGRFLDLAKEL